jgi:lysozyme family protein
MKENFLMAVTFTINEETGGDASGAYHCDPSDPGGETKWGICKRYHPNLDIEHLTFEDAKALYYMEYWIRNLCDTMPTPLDIFMFDSCVQPGVQHANEFLLSSGQDPLRFLLHRVSWYRQQVEKYPVKQKYFRGWINRTDDLFVRFG